MSVMDITAVFFAAFPPEGGPARGYGACPRCALSYQGAPGDIVFEIDRASHDTGGLSYDAETGAIIYP